MDQNELLKNADLQAISEKGNSIYEKIKSKYEPEHTGKFLAIETDTEQVYLEDSSAEAVELAKREHPDKIFYVVKIGHSSAETLASLGAA